MNAKRFSILIMLLGLLLIGIMPVLAQENLDIVAYTDNYLKNELPQGWGIVTVEDLSLELLENPPFLVDVREVSEVEETGYIAGAINIPVRELAANLDKLPSDLDANIVVYCKSGTRGTIGMVALQLLGYTHVRNMAGGIMAWMGAEYEVVTDPMEVMSGEPAAIDPDLVARVDGFLKTGVPQGWGMVKTEDLSLELLENPPFLLDVRQPEELVDLGYIEGAVNVPVRELASNLDKLPADKDAPIVVYCKSGTRGTIGMLALQFMGYTNVRNLSGGIVGWIDAGYPVVTG